MLGLEQRGDELADWRLSSPGRLLRESNPMCRRPPGLIGGCEYNCDVIHDWFVTNGAEELCELHGNGDVAFLLAAQLRVRHRARPR